MTILQNPKITHSPVQQDFVWVAEYANGEHLSEFSFDTHKENSFYDIERDKLFRFGLLGHGIKIYFERDGLFNIAGRSIQFYYEENGKRVKLNNDFKYNVTDIITFKDAESTGLIMGAMGSGSMSSGTIMQYNIGYKVQIATEIGNFSFKPIIKLPSGQPMYIEMTLVADRELNGKLVVQSGAYVVQEFDAPLKEGKGGVLNWVIV